MFLRLQRPVTADVVAYPAEKTDEGWGGGWKGLRTEERETPQ